MPLRTAAHNEMAGLPPVAVDLLIARLCHDVAGPAGAILNGIELAADLGPDSLSETLDLLDQSGRRLVDRMAAFRFAYAGRVAAGPDGLPSAALAEVVGLVAATLSHGRIALQWPREAADQRLPASLARSLLVALMAGEDLVQGKGGLRLTVPPAGSDRLGDRPRIDRVRLDVTGPRVIWAQEQAAALYGTAPLERLTARDVHLYMLGALVRRFGQRLEVDPVEERIGVTLTAL